MILIGTAGFSYDDWRGPFYPEKTPREKMLELYAGEFPLVELDYTYYSMPSERTMASFARRTPESFLFAVKLHKSITHERESAEGMSGAFRDFLKAVGPLTDSGKLACLLAQYPWSFKPGDASRRTLRELREKTADLPVVVEFRNAQWVSEETFEFLRDLGLGFCCVDEPGLPGLMPPLCMATTDLGYVRFHGRNAAAWWKHGNASERYNYLYSEEELSSWKPRLLNLDAAVPRTLVLFNNCHGGNAAVNARMLKAILGVR